MTTVTMNDINLYDNYGLVLADKEIESPEAKRITVEIDGRDGELDLTSKLFGVSANYGPRDINLTFITTDKISGMTKAELFRGLMDTFHGKAVTVEFSDDAGYTWSGSCSVECDSEGKKREVQMTITANPYCTDASGNKHL